MLFKDLVLQKILGPNRNALGTQFGVWTHKLRTAVLEVVIELLHVGVL